MAYFEQVGVKDTSDKGGASISNNAIDVNPRSMRIESGDINILTSNNNGFTGIITDYFDSLTSVNYNDSATNPKTIEVRFTESFQIDEIGFGCNDPARSFSNIKIKILGSADAIRAVADESTNSTKYTSRVIKIAPETANGVIIEFHTSDRVDLSNLLIYKSQKTTARIQGVGPDGEVGDVGITKKGQFKVSIEEYGDTPAVDAFAALRVSEKFTLFDSKQLHDKQPLFWDESLGGSATSVHLSADACVEMSVTNSVSDFAIRQTKQRFNYQPGKSSLAFITFQTTQVSGLTKRVGLFDGTGTNNMTPNNGIFFSCDGNVTWNIAKNGTTTESVSMSAWNVDTFDGSGNDNNPSGIELNLDSAQILIIDYEWLGVGRVRVGFVIDGLIHYCHYFNHANDPAFPSVYMSTPNLPIRYDITSDGTASGDMKHICSTVISEGGIEKTGILRTVKTGNSFIPSYGTANSYALIGIRLKSNYLDITVIPESISIVCGSSDAFAWELHLNPTINGTFTYTDLVYSATQYAIGGITNTIASEGLILASGAASVQSRQTSESLQTALRIGSTIAGVRDTLVLVLRPLTANLSQRSALNFRELL